MSGGTKIEVKVVDKVKLNDLVTRFVFEKTDGSNSTNFLRWISYRC